MTYRELRAELNLMSEDNLDLDVTVFHPRSEEFYSAVSIGIIDTNVLDEGHPVLTIKE